MNKEREHLGCKTWREAEVAAKDRVEEEDQWPHFPRGKKGSMMIMMFADDTSIIKCYANKDRY